MKINNQHGMALVLGLIMMFVLTILAISGVNDNIIESRLASNAQTKTVAFQAAETGLNQSMKTSNILVTAINSPSNLVSHGYNLNAQANAHVDIEYTGQGPTAGFSIKSGSGFTAHNFEFDSTGKSDNNKAISQHLLGVARIGPGS